MAFQPGDVVFVDESKAHGYHLVAVGVAPGDLATVEKSLKGLRSGGRSIIHFKDERRERERILNGMLRMPLRVAVFSMRGTPDRIARPELLRVLIDYLVDDSVRSLTLERDDSVEQLDRRIIRHRLDKQDASQSLSYVHASKKERPVLWVADAIAWCYQKGGVWRSKAARIVVEQIVVRGP